MCYFCSLKQDGLVGIVEDNYPVTKGHVLIFPTQHIRYLEDVPEDTLTELWATVTRFVRELDCDCNIGINNGRWAGQTVHHLHVHIIPRTEGDVADPRGGVRWVIPEKADYWTGLGR